MNNWFSWNGTSCTTYGMYVLTQPTYQRAKERTSAVKVPGRSGSLTFLEGDCVYDDIVLECECYIPKPFEFIDGVTRINKISAWLRGEGIIRFANRSDGFFIGRVSNQISFERILRGNENVKFVVQFTCRPFIYLESGLTTYTATQSTNTISRNNPGTIPSEPLLKVYNNGSTGGTIMCGNSTMIIDDISDLSYLYLDCAAKIAYSGEPGNVSDPLILRGTRVTGEWLTIPAGSYFFVITGSLTSVVVTPNWRCL